VIEAHFNTLHRVKDDYCLNIQIENDMEKKSLKPRYYYYEDKKIDLFESDTHRVVKINKRIIDEKGLITNLRGPYYLIENNYFRDNFEFKRARSFSVLSHPENPLKNNEILVPIDQLIMKFKKGLSILIPILEQILKKYNLKKSNLKQWDKNTFILNVPVGIDSLDISNELYSNKELPLEYVQPNFLRVLEPFAFPNDTHYVNKNQWYLNGANGIDAVNAWTITKGDPSIVIAIIDEGVDFNHPDLINKKHSSYVTVTGNSNTNPEDNHIHGTLCAGVAAAQGNNNLGVIGVAPGSKIMSVKVALRDNANPNNWIILDSDVASGISTAVNNGAHILNCSWGMNFPSNPIRTELTKAKTNGRNGKGCVICCSTGNNSATIIAFPSSVTEAMAIGASKRTDGKRASFSNWDSNVINVDLCAPGVEIWTTTFSGQSPNRVYDYKKEDGTSFSAPQVAGTAALVLSVNPNMTADDVCKKIRDTSVDIIPQNNEDKQTGKGRLNVFKAVQ
jgi:subtilisin family serine protease